MNKEIKDFTEEELEIAHSMAGILSHVANRIMQSSSPKAAFAAMIECLGSGSEHMAACPNCDYAEEADACGVTQDQFKQAAYELNVALCEAIGTDSPLRDTMQTPKHFH